MNKKIVDIRALSVEQIQKQSFYVTNNPLNRLWSYASSFLYCDSLWTRALCACLLQFDIQDILTISNGVCVSNSLYCWHFFCFPCTCRDLFPFVSSSSRSQASQPH